MVTYSPPGSIASSTTRFWVAASAASCLACYEEDRLSIETLMAIVAYIMGLSVYVAGSKRVV